MAQPSRTRLGMGQVAIGVVATKIVGHDSDRKQLVLTNVGTEVAVISLTPQLALGDGYPIAVNGFITVPTEMEIWGICATGAALVGWMVEY